MAERRATQSKSVYRLYASRTAIRRSFCIGIPSGACVSLISRSSHALRDSIPERQHDQKNDKLFATYSSLRVQVLLDFRPENIHKLVMASIEEVVELLKSNRPKMLRYMAAVQLLLGLFLLFMAYYMGHTHLHLIRAGGVRPAGSLVTNNTISSARQAIREVSRRDFCRSSDRKSVG